MKTSLEENNFDLKGQDKSLKTGGGKRKTTRSRKNGGNDVPSLQEKNKDQGGTNINILPGSGGAKKKNKKRNTKKRSSKTKGGFWPFTKKEEPKLDGVGPDPPAAASDATEEKKEPTTQGKIKYPMMTLSYGGNSISCDVCKNNKYYKMDMSISRSKVASITSGIILINGVTDIISHPVKCYLCTTCLNCRFVYATTTWNKLKTVIEETKVEG